MAGKMHEEVLDDRQPSRRIDIAAACLTIASLHPIGSEREDHFVDRLVAIAGLSDDVDRRILRHQRVDHVDVARVVRPLIEFDGVGLAAGGQIGLQFDRQKVFVEEQRRRVQRLVEAVGAGRRRGDERGDNSQGAPQAHCTGHELP